MSTPRPASSSTLAEDRLDAATTAPVRSAFISYAREDTDWALEKARTLRQVGIECFLDVDSIRNGENWKQELNRALSKADRFILGWSSYSSGSESVRREYERAIEIRDREGIAQFILIDLLDSTDLPAVLSETHGQPLDVAREIRLPNAALVGLASSLLLWSVSRHSELVASLWASVAVALFAAGLTLLYVYYAAPEHLRRVRVRFSDLGTFLSAATPRSLLGQASRLIDVFYAGPVFSARALRRTVFVSILAVTLPNMIATGWFIASAQDWELHYAYILRYWSVAQIAAVLLAPLVLNAVADVVSVSTSRFLIDRAVPSGGLSGFLGLGIAVPVAALLASAPLVAMTSADAWPSVDVWISDLANIVVAGESTYYGDVEVVLARVLFASTAASACLPLLAVVVVFLGSGMARVSHGAVYRLAGRLLLAMSRDARGPLAVVYSVVSIGTLFIAVMTS